MEAVRDQVPSTFSLRFPYGVDRSARSLKTPQPILIPAGRGQREREALWLHLLCSHTVGLNWVMRSYPAPREAPDCLCGFKFAVVIEVIGKEDALVGSLSAPLLELRAIGRIRTRTLASKAKPQLQHKPVFCRHLPCTGKYMTSHG